MDSIRVTITIPKDFLKKMKVSAKKRGMSLSGFIRFAVSEIQKGE
jgi:predicted DNA binding CopG/RHH family protein